MTHTHPTLMGIAFTLEFLHWWAVGVHNMVTEPVTFMLSEVTVD